MKDFIINNFRYYSWIAFKLLIVTILNAAPAYYLINQSPSFLLEVHMWLVILVAFGVWGVGLFTVVFD